jgi:hypothetical protein
MYFDVDNLGLWKYEHRKKNYDFFYLYFTYHFENVRAGFLKKGVKTQLGKIADTGANFISMVVTRVSSKSSKNHTFLMCRMQKSFYVHLWPWLII